MTVEHLVACKADLMAEVMVDWKVELMVDWKVETTDVLMVGKTAATTDASRAEM